MILNPVTQTCESAERDPIPQTQSCVADVAQNNIDFFCRESLPTAADVPDFFVVPWLCDSGKDCRVPAAEYFGTAAILAHDRKDFEGAICYWNLAIDIDPLEYRSYWGRGVTFASLDLPMMAGADFLVAHDLNPSAPEPWLYLGINELNLGAAASAEHFLTGFNDSFPENPEGNLYLGILALINEEPLRALYLFETALQLDPNLNSARISKGIALVQLGDFEESLDSLNIGIQAGADDAQAFLFRGTALARLGRFAEAKNDFATALSIDPSNATAAQYYSQVAEDLGR